MTEKFVASNGWYLEDGHLHTPMGTKMFSSIGMDCLREIFQHERDRELGRWRWPENPDYVVYSTEVTGANVALGSGYQECVVVDESTGFSQGFGSELPSCYGGNPREAARAYFAVRSEPKPEWHDAKPGEVWVANIRTGPTFDEVALQVMEYFTGGIVFKDHIEDIHYPLTDPAIISARKIWPVSDV